MVARRQRSYEDSTWTHPYAGRDTGLALFGKQIRCNIPKEYECERRVLEGEIVGLLDYGTKGLIRADLLIDEQLLAEFKFLKRQDGDQHQNDKKAVLEQRIKGKNKAIVRVKLKNPYEPAGNGLKWVIIKEVPPKLFHVSRSTVTKKRKRAPVMHVGDGDDSHLQQIENWRWLASRYHDMSLSAGKIPEGMGLIGEVVGIQSHVGSPEGSSIATVTVRQMVIPEFTAYGRQPFHDTFDIFYDGDSANSSVTQIPVEELVVVARSLISSNGTIEHSKGPVLVNLGVKFAYSLRDDIYFDGEEDRNSGVPCHRCRKVQLKEDFVVCHSSECPLFRPFHQTLWCSDCLVALSTSPENVLPCCRRACDCRFCVTKSCDDVVTKFHSLIESVVQSKKRPKVDTIFSELETVRFGLSHDFINPDSVPMPAAKPSIRVKAKTSKKYIARKLLSPEKSITSVLDGPENGQKRSGRKKKKNIEKTVEMEDLSVFKPTCARLLNSSDARARKGVLPCLVTSGLNRSDLPRILRQTRLEIEKETREEKKTSSSRAARASQRRFMKDVQSFGADILGVDMLAAREPMLRFDRSPIHAWGVTADEEISAGTMIVEYRGEIIGNAMTEKREKEYERAKIGSDYMFRIDKTTVCDATKQGNVARFINHSCSPNCYTKIITSEGSKRIVIYAKNDIAVGEELCYDYKFPLEPDESKRIPCHCGARDCRGFMNWDKRYVAVPPVSNQQVEHSPTRRHDSDSSVGQYTG